MSDGPTPHELADREWAEIGKSGRARSIIHVLKLTLMTPPSPGLSDCALRADVGYRNALADILRRLESETALVDDGRDPKLGDGHPPAQPAPRGLRRRGEGYVL